MSLSFPFFVNVRLRSWRVAPKVNASMSSVPTACAFPPFTSSPHCASASQGASTTGTPIIRNRALTSSQSFLETFVSIPLYFSMSSVLPSCCAFLSFSSASLRLAWRLANSPSFASGGLPSKTYTGLTPLSSNLIVRLNMPWMWDVCSPSLLVRTVAGPPSLPWPRIAMRNWYKDMLASIATMRPV